jgi:hypothetical protein
MIMPGTHKLNSTFHFTGIPDGPTVQLFHCPSAQIPQLLTPGAKTAAYGNHLR